jgi:hypothetical protein
MSWTITEEDKYSFMIYAIFVEKGSGKKLLDGSQ